MLKKAILGLALLWMSQAGSAFGQGANYPGGSGGGITSVSSLPTTCTPGVTAPVQLSVAPFGLYVCTSTNVWARDDLSGGSFVSAASYGVVPGFIATDCGSTSSSPNLVCTNTTFTSAMIGWLAHYTNGCCGSISQIGSVYEFPLNSGAENTIIGCSPSCPSKTAILSQNASATVTNTAGILTVGPDMTSTLSSMVTAVWNTPTSSPNCAAILMPGPIVMTKKGQFNTATCKMPVQGASASLPDTQASVQSWNGFSSMLAPTQDFDFTTGSGNSCGGKSNAGNTSCFFGIQGIRLFNVGINGGGASLTGSSHVATLVALGNDSSMNGFVCSGFGASDTSLLGVEINTGAQAVLLTQLDGCGRAGLTVNDTLPAVLSNSFVGDNGISNLAIFGLLFSSTNGFAGLGGGGGGASVQVGSGGEWHSFGDNAESGTANSQSVNVLNLGTAYLNNFYCSMVVAASTCLAVQSGGTATMGSSHVVVPATGNAVAIAGTFNDLGGNVYSPIPNANFGTGNSPNYVGSQSINGTCTGTATSSSTLGLYGTGPNQTTTTCTSTTIGSGIVMNRAGTLGGLYVSATHAGVNASSGVVTVLKNGSPTTITCTVGTATTCTDVIHTVAFVRGDLISYQFTTQAAEVLAGINAIVGAQ